MSSKAKTLFLAIDARKARQGAVAFRQAKRMVQGDARKIGASTKAMNASMRQSGAAIKSMILPMVGFMGALKGVATIAKFEESMATLGAVTGEVNISTRETTAAFAEMQHTARELGATTRHSASAAADGMLELARAGFTANESIDAIAHTLDLATAANIGLAEASGYVANSVRQFGLEASAANDVADAFVTVSNKSNTTVSELAEAMKMVGTVAASVGYSVEETAVAIGVLGDRGVKATMAGTQLRGTLIGLAATTEKARQAMAELGLATEDLDPAQNSLHDIAVKLDGAFSKLGNRYDALGIASEIFGRRNASAALALASAKDKIAELTEEAIASTSAHKDMADVMDDTVIGAWYSLKSAVEETMLVMGDAGALGGLRDLIDTAAEMVRIWGGVTDAWEDASIPAKAMATVLEVIVARFVLVKSLGMIAWLGSFSGAMVASAFATAGLSGAITAVGRAISSNAIGLALTGIAAGYIMLSSALEEKEVAEKKAGAQAKTNKEVIKGLAENESRLHELRRQGNIVSSSGQVLMFKRQELLERQDVTLREMITTTEGVQLSELAWYETLVMSAREEEKYNDTRQAAIKLLGNLQSELAMNADEQANLAHFLAITGLEHENILAQMSAYQVALTASDLAVLANVDSIRLEIAMLEKRGDSIAETIALQEALRVAARDGINTDSDRFSLLVEEIELRNEAKKSLDAYINSEKGLSDDSVLSAMDAMIQRLVNMGLGLDEARDRATQITLSGEAMNNAFSDAFGGIIRGTASAKDALKSLFDFILDEMLKLAVLNPLKDMMSGWFEGLAGWAGNGGGTPDYSSGFGGFGGTPDTYVAHGGAFDGNGAITNFARGGVVRKSTDFAFAGGMGRMGEAGAEVVLPLKPDSKGNLGVISTGGGQSQPISVSMTVITKDADSFRRSQSQIESDMRRTINRLK